MNQQPSNHDRVQNYSQDELRAMIENEEAVDGGTHPTLTTFLVPVTLALCPTTKCSKRC